MKTKRIKKSMEVKAPKQKVWEVLFNDKFTRQWYAEFSEGSHAETDWKLNSKVVFTDHSKNGIVGKIVENKPYEVLTIEYNGVVVNGKEDYQSEEAVSFKGAIEKYELSSNNGSTRIYIESDMSEPYYDSMNAAWDRALEHIRKLSEGK